MSQTTISTDVLINIFTYYVDVGESLKISRVNRFFHSILGINSKDRRLSRRHRVFRFILKYIDKMPIKNLIDSGVLPISMQVNLLVEPHLGQLSHKWAFASEPFVLQWLEELEGHVPKVVAEKISSNENLGDDFFDKHPRCISWKQLSRFGCLSEAFWEKYSERIVWPILASNENVPESFFRKQIERLDWKYLTLNHGVSIQFLMEYHDKIDWGVITSRSDLTEQFCRTNLQLIQNLEMTRSDLSLAFWEYAWQNHVFKNGVILSSNSHVPEEFIENYLMGPKSSIHSLNFCISNPNLSEAFWERHMGDWEGCSSLSCNRGLSVDFFRRHPECISWPLLCANPVVDLDFLEENLDELNWGILSANRFGLM